MKQLEFGEKNVRVRWAGVKEYFGGEDQGGGEEAIGGGIAGGVSILRLGKFEKLFQGRICLLQIPPKAGLTVTS
jgi:hypothetical protein